MREKKDRKMGKEYQNPVLRGFNPDPSICRVGKDFYMVTSSFEYFPAIPIYHSTDLVNWEQIGNCLGFESNFDLTGAKESGGVWAPTIRYDNGLFYVTAAMEQLKGNQFGNFIIHTADICGAWSKPVWIDIGGIDPSLYFENQKAYYCTNDNQGEEQESIKLGVVNPLTGETLEAFRTIWHGTGGGWLEAPHIYHVGDWYYIMCAEGGTSFGHHEVIGRAKDIWGPYESCPNNPILTNRNDTSKQAICCGHGDMTEDGNGNWWMVHLGHRSGKIALSPLGRETFLTPFFWQDGWPVIQSNMARIQEQGPIWNKQNPWKAKEDDFSGSEWPCWWYFVRRPQLSHYTRGAGKLMIEPFGVRPSANEMQGFAGTKQPDIAFGMEVLLHFLPVDNGEAAGILIWLTHDFYYFFGIRKSADRRELFLERKMEDLDVTAWTEETEAEDVHLMVEGTKDEYVFYTVEKDGKRTAKCSASSRFLSNEIVGRGFTGTMVGLYAESIAEHKTPAVFSQFALRNPAAE